MAHKLQFLGRSELTLSQSFGHGRASSDETISDETISDETIEAALTTRACKMRGAAQWRIIMNLNKETPS